MLEHSFLKNLLTVLSKFSSKKLQSIPRFLKFWNRYMSNSNFIRKLEMSPRKGTTIFLKWGLCYCCNSKLYFVCFCCLIRTLLGSRAKLSLRQVFSRIKKHFFFGASGCKQSILAVANEYIRYVTAIFYLRSVIYTHDWMCEWILEDWCVNDALYLESCKFHCLDRSVVRKRRIKYSVARKVGNK